MMLSLALLALLCAAPSAWSQPTVTTSLPVKSEHVFGALESTVSYVSSVDYNCWVIRPISDNVAIWTSDWSNCTTSVTWSTTSFHGPHFMNQTCHSIPVGLKTWNNQFWAMFNVSTTNRLTSMIFWATANILGASLHNIDTRYVWTTATPQITFTQGCAALMNVGYQNLGAFINLTMAADNNDCISATLTNLGATSRTYRYNSDVTCTQTWGYSAKDTAPAVLMNETCNNGVSHQVYSVARATTLSNVAWGANVVPYVSRLQLTVVSDTAAKLTVGDSMLWTTNNHFQRAFRMSAITGFFVCNANLSRSISYTTDVFAGTFSNDPIGVNRVIVSALSGGQWSLGRLAAPMTVWQNGSAANTVNAIIAAKPVCATVEIAWQQLIYAVPRSAYTDVVFAFKINCTDVSANRNLVYRGVGTTSGAGVTAPFIKYSLSVNTLPEPHDLKWPVHTASTADSFFQTLTAGILLIPGAWLLDNGQCVTLASTPTAIAAPAVFWFRSVSFYPTNVTAATLCTATLESPSTPGAVSPQVAFELKLSCTSNSNWWRAVITNMTSNWGSARVAVSRAADTGGVSAVNLYAAFSSATYVPVSATILAVAVLSSGCTRSEPLVVTPPTPVGVISYQASIATNASVCLSVLRLDESTLVVRSFPSGSAPATSVANETLYLVYPSVAGLEISQTFTAYHTVDGGATFTLSYVNLVSTPTTAIFFTNYSNHVYAPQTSAFCANVAAPTWALPSPAFAPPFIVTGQLTIANRISQTYPHYLFNTTAGYAARIVWPVNYMTQLSQLLGIFPYRFASFSLSTLTASVSSSVIDYRITADPWAGESSTWTDSTLALVTQLNSWQARGALGPMAILSPNSTAVAPAPVLLWRCADGVTYLTTCVPASVVNATPTPAPAKALTSVRMSLAMTVQAAFDLTFQSAFKTALAGFLGIPVLRISIGSVTSGSAVIQVVILPPPTDATATGANALSSLQLSNVLVAAAANPSSPLFTAVAANTQVTLNVGASLFLSVLCPDGSYQAICSVPNVTIAPVTPAPAFFPAAVVAAAAYYCYRKRAEMQAQRDFEMSNRNKQY